MIGLRIGKKVLGVTGLALTLLAFLVIVSFTKWGGHQHGNIANGPFQPAVKIKSSLPETYMDMPLQGGRVALDSSSQVSRSLAKEGGRDCSLTLVCVNESGQAVGDAAIYSPSPEADSYMGRTSEDGTLLVAVKSDQYLRFEAVSSNLIGASDPVVGGTVKVLEIVMRPTSAISGTVLNADGFPFGAGIRVQAIPESNSLSDTLWCERALSGSSLRPIATSLSDGSFVILGLSSKESYFLIAGGGGYASLETPDGIGAGESGIQITVSPVFGAVLSILGQDGEALSPKTGAWLTGVAFGFGDGEGYVESGRAQPISVSKALLAGVSPTLIRDLGLYRHAFFFVSDVRSESVGPVQFCVDLPGYDPIRTTVWAQLLSTGVASYEVRVARTTEGFGRLTVNLEGALPRARLAKHSPGFYSFATVRLIPLAGGAILKYGIIDLLQDSQTFEGIPFGTYTIDILPNHSMLRFPETLRTVIEIGSAEVAVTFDLSNTGGVEVLILDENGGVFDGYCSVELHRTDSANDVLGISAFLESPYVVSGLPEGTYAVRLGTPSVLEEDSSGVAVPVTKTAIVRPGEYPILTYRLP